MEKPCGVLERVGDLTGGQLVGQQTKVRVATVIPTVQIGSTTLTKVRCDPELFPHLMPGRQACLYVFRHFHIWPAIIGVKYGDGSKFLASKSWMRASYLQYVVIGAIMAAFAGGIAGEIIGSVLGIGTFLGGVGFLAGIGDAWWNAFRLRSDYAQAMGD